MKKKQILLLVFNSHLNTNVKRWNHISHMLHLNIPTYMYELNVI